MSELHFIVNPVAGGNTCLARFKEIEAELSRRGADYSVVYSSYTGHAFELARQAVKDGHRRVVAVGGDGTVREVAGGLIFTDALMGILPFGTGNDLTRHLGLLDGRVNITDMLLHGGSRPIDAAMAGEHVYVNVAGLGFDVDALERSHRSKNSIFGSYSYLFGLLRALLHLRTYRVRISGGECEINSDVFLVSVGNGTHFGGGIAITPRANVRDGLLDVCVIKKTRGLSVPVLLLNVLRGKHLKLDNVHYFRTEALTIECDAGANVQLDGEIIGKTPITFKILPKAINMIAEDA